VSLSEQVRKRIRDVEDFPKPGIVFKDITPLLGDGSLFERVTDWMVEAFRSEHPTHVLAIESRGFIFASPVAHRLGAGLVPVRKPGKLPWSTVRVSYDLEYGRDAIEIHADALGAGDRVLIIDDLLATGGTAAAACALVEKLGASPVGICVAMELSSLEGRRKLEGRRVKALVRF
jgi:adenine phosphoribosyltransferase